MSESMRYNAHPSDEVLSAYYDAALSSGERAQVAGHLAGCERCRLVLAEYARWGEALRSPVMPAPAALQRELEERLARRSLVPAWRRLPGLVATASVLAIMAYAVMIWPASQPLALAIAYPARDATAVSLDAVVEIVYAANVDREAVAQNVRLEPNVLVNKSWRGDTLVIQPQAPLQPNTIYSVRAPAAAPAKSAPLPPLVVVPAVPTPQEVTSFRTASAAAAAAVSATPVASAKAAVAGAAVATPALALASSATPGATVAATARAAAATSASVRATAGKLAEPAKGFGVVYHQAGVAEALGAVQSEARHVKVTEQRFENGRLLAVAAPGDADEVELYVLTNDGRLQSYQTGWTTEAVSAADTSGPPKGLLEPKQLLGRLWRERPEVRQALGWALETERQLNGDEYQFAGGTMVGHDRKLVYVLLGDGTWQDYADPWQETTPTPTRTATATPAGAGNNGADSSPASQSSG